MEARRSQNPTKKKFKKVSKIKLAGPKIDGSVNLLKEGRRIVNQKKGIKLAPELKCTVDEAVMSCSNKPFDGRIDFTWDDSVLKRMAQILIMKLNQVTDFIPTDNLTAGMVFVYLKRCAAWHAWRGKMINTMPIVNAARYRLPIWIANWMENWSPYVNPMIKASITPHIQGLADTEWGPSYEPALQTGSSLVTPVASVVSGERTFSNPAAVAVTLVDSEACEKVSNFLGSNFQCVFVEDLKTVTTNGDFYLDTGNNSFDHTFDIARYISPIRSAVKFMGMHSAPGVSTHNDYQSLFLGILSDICQVPHKTVRRVYKSAHVPLHGIAIHVNSIDFSQIGTLVASVMLANDIPPEADFNNQWWWQYILQTTMYCAHGPAWVRALQGQDPTRTRAYYLSPLAKQIKTLPCFTELQGIGWHVNSSIHVIVPTWGLNPPFPTPAPVLGAATLTPSTPFNQHISFDVEPVYPAEVSAGANYNVFPLNTLNEVIRAADRTTHALGMRAMPGMVKSWAAYTNIAYSSEIDGSGTGYYQLGQTAVTQLTSYSVLTPEECFMRKAGTLTRITDINRYFERIYGTYPISQGIAEHAVPDSSDRVLIGQKSNQAVVARDLFLNKVMEYSPTASMTLDAVYELARGYVDDKYLPSKSQLERLVKGQMSFPEVLGAIAGMGASATFDTIRNQIGPTVSFRALRLPAS